MIEPTESHGINKEEILDRILQEKLEITLGKVETWHHGHVDLLSKLHGELDTLTHSATELEDHYRRIAEQKAQAEEAKRAAEEAKKAAEEARKNASASKAGGIGRGSGTKAGGESKIGKSKDDQDIDTAGRGSGVKKGLTRNQSEAVVGLGRSGLGKTLGGDTGKTGKGGAKTTEDKKDEAPKSTRPQTVRNADDKKTLFQAPKTTKASDSTKITFGKKDEEKKEDDGKGKKALGGGVLGAKKDTKTPRANLNKSFAGHETSDKKEDSKNINKSFAIDEKDEDKLNAKKDSKGSVLKGLTSPKGAQSKGGDKAEEKDSKKATKKETKDTKTPPPPKKYDKNDDKKATKDIKKGTKGTDEKKEEEKKEEEPKPISTGTTDEQQQKKENEKKTTEPVEDKAIKQPEQQNAEVNHADSDEKRIESAADVNEEKKVEEHKPEEQKPEEHKPEEQKPEEQKPEEKKVEEHKPEENNHAHTSAENGQTHIDEGIYEDLERETGKKNIKAHLEKKGKAVDEYIRHLYLKYEKKISALTVELEGLQQQEKPKEPYAIKTSTKSIIEMVEKGWVEELRDKPDADEKIYRIMDMFLRFKKQPGIPSFKKQPAEFWAYCKQYLTQNEDNFVSLLNETEAEVEHVPITTKLKMEKVAKEDGTVLNPSTFDNIDALSGVVSFMMKEVTEHMGLVLQENKKGQNNADKIYGYSKEKSDYFNQQQDKLIAISKKYNISTQ